MKNVRLYNDDCYKALDELEKENVKVDLVLTDPPYYIDTTNAKKKKVSSRIDKSAGLSAEQLSFVADGFDYKKLYSKIEKLQDKVNVVMFCCNDQVGELQTFFTSKGLNVDICVWNKYNAMPIANGHILNDAEYIVVAREKGATWNNDCPLDFKRRIFTEPLVSNKFHPCEKPLSILNKLVLLYSKPNATILDPFMGSGTTGISAVKNDRDFIGIELVEKYCDIARVRIDNENRQQRLF